MRTWCRCYWPAPSGTMQGSRAANQGFTGSPSPRAATAAAFWQKVAWWSGRDSNPLPPRCERGALPDELPPQVLRRLVESRDRERSREKPCSASPLLEAIPKPVGPPAGGSRRSRSGSRYRVATERSLPRREGAGGRLQGLGIGSSRRCSGGSGARAFSSSGAEERGIRSITPSR